MEKALLQHRVLLDSLLLVLYRASLDLLASFLVNFDFLVDWIVILGLYHPSLAGHPVSIADVASMVDYRVDVASMVDYHAEVASMVD